LRATRGATDAEAHAPAAELHAPPPAEANAEVRSAATRVRDVGQADGEWTLEAWLFSLHLHRVVSEALTDQSSTNAFEYAKTTLGDGLEAKLKDAKLEGLLDEGEAIIRKAVEGREGFVLEM
jgi:hypothetical protein